MKTLKFIDQTEYLLFPKNVSLQDAKKLYQLRSWCDCNTNCNIQDLIIAINMANGDVDSLNIYLDILADGKHHIFTFPLATAVEQLEKEIVFDIDPYTGEWKAGDDGESVIERDFSFLPKN